MADARDPAADLRQIAFLLERAREPRSGSRPSAPRPPCSTTSPPPRSSDEPSDGTLRELKGIGASTATSVTESLAGEVPAYLTRLEASAQAPELDESTAQLYRLLRGDCHTHSDWSDGGSPIAEMAQTARAIGHDYVVLTDHSPRVDGRERVVARATGTSARRRGRAERRLRRGRGDVRSAS